MKERGDNLLELLSLIRRNPTIDNYNSTGDNFKFFLYISPVMNPFARVPAPMDANHLDREHFEYEEF